MDRVRILEVIDSHHSVVHGGDTGNDMSIVGTCRQRVAIFYQSVLLRYSVDGDVAGFLVYHKLIVTARNGFLLTIHIAVQGT